MHFAHPKKALGQNFLKDANQIAKIIAALNVGVDDVIIEIGPGRGALTELLLAQSIELHIIEFDNDLADYWQSRAVTENGLTIHHADALKFDFANLLVRFKNRPIKLIGNLPYNIASPILFRLLPLYAQIERQVFMLQKEVVERISAKPGSKQFGRLSVMLQYVYMVENLFTVPPAAFFPKPKVDSAVARFQPRQPGVIEAKDIGRLEVLVKQAFSQRRKTLRNNLKPLVSEADIVSLDIDPGARPETLPVSDFVALSKLCLQDAGKEREQER